MYGSAATPLLTITEGVKTPLNVRGIVDELMAGATYSTLWNVPIDLSALSIV